MGSPAPERRAFDAEQRRRLEANLRRVFARHPEIDAAYVYGSVARGEPAGDLDVAVLFRGDAPSHRQLEALASELQREAAPTGPDVDLRPLAGTGPRFRASVVREGDIVYERDANARIAFEARTMSEWLDFKPTWERMRARMRQRWTGG